MEPGLVVDMGGVGVGGARIALADLRVELFTVGFRKGPDCCCDHLRAVGFSNTREVLLRRGLRIDWGLVIFVFVLGRDLGVVSHVF